VVLLHGWIATGASNWRGTFATLAESYHVVALDHRGHGRGIRADGAFTLEDCADDVVALLDALDVRSAVLVGYSMGGPIAQLTWRRWPERVDALVLCATAADFTQPAIPAPVLGVAETVVSATIAATRPVRAANPFGQDPAIGEDGEIAEGLLDSLGRHDVRTVHRALHQIARYDARGWIGAVDVPAAVIVTGRDRTVSPARQRALAAAIPGAATIDTDGGHLLPFTDPDATADVLREACRTVLSRVERHRPPLRARLRAWWHRVRTRRRLGSVGLEHGDGPQATLDVVLERSRRQRRHLVGDR
jgi:pimeloyl-ACP methyl ester carboxylesterase